MKVKIMDAEIKRLLKLESIPNYILNARDAKTLEEWKAKQVNIKPVVVKKKEIVIPEGYTTVEGITVNGEPALIKEENITKKKRSRSRKKTTNQVKKVDKEIGEVKES